jgi:hypothetical protein
MRHSTGDVSEETISTIDERWGRIAHYIMTLLSPCSPSTTAEHNHAFKTSMQITILYSQFPAMLVKRCLVGLGIGRINGRRLSRAFGMQEKAVIVIQARKHGNPTWLVSVRRHGGCAGSLL